MRADIPQQSHATNVLIRIPLPKDTASAFVDFGQGSDSTYEYNSVYHWVHWHLPKFVGQTEHLCRIRIALGSPLVGDPKRHVGPIR